VNCARRPIWLRATGCVGSAPCVRPWPSGERLISVYAAQAPAAANAVFPQLPSDAAQYTVGSSTIVIGSNVCVRACPCVALLACEFPSCAWECVRDCCRRRSYVMCYDELGVGGSVMYYMALDPVCGSRAPHMCVCACARVCLSFVRVLRSQIGQWQPVNSISPTVYSPAVATTRTCARRARVPLRRARIHTPINHAPRTRARRTAYIFGGALNSNTLMASVYSFR
jgi:hypothetical protein